MSDLALKLIRENIAAHERGEDARFLDLGNCGMTEVPEEIGKCVWLEELILSNEWSELYFGADLISLSQNGGEYNNLQNLTPELSKLSGLKKLIFADSEIIELTPITKLANLQYLDCSGTKIIELTAIASLTNLHQLHFYRTQIADLTPITGLTNLQYLDCSDTKIVELNAIAGLTNLHQLNCSRTQVADLTPTEGLVNLRELYCFGTQIKDLTFLTRLNNIQALYCSSTQITDLVPISGLSQLKKLDCSSTQITDLTPISELSQLNQLDCSSTQITDLTPISELSQLNQLDCSSTQAADLGPISGLSNLQEFNCSNTTVTNLRPILKLIRKSIAVTIKGYANNKNFDFKDCPLIHPPAEIVQQGNEAILNYFAEREEAGTEKSLEAKIVLIGEGMSGKTSLRTRLMKGERAPLPPKDERTKGLDVEVEPYYVDLPDGERLRLNIFDFGGQKHYKPLHQFFYSHRSLYVLVTRNGDDSNEFDFWFDTAQLFGGGSPVMIVNNLFGDVPSGFSRSKYARFDAILKDSLDTNLETCTGFSAVKKRIGQIAEELSHVHQSIPKTWANVRRALEKLRFRNIISLQEYLELCALEENGSMDRERALFCSAYLHDIGACLHYQQFPLLKRKVIVRNEWATEAVYRVMDDIEVGRKNGHFNMTDLERIWKPKQEDIEQGENFHYEDYQPELLELMRRFKLCFPLKSGDDFVAPHLLPNKQDNDLQWQPDNDLQFEIEYDFLPSGLFPRFVVRRYEDIAGDNRNHVWSDEVFFKWEDTEANVQVPSRAGKKTIVFRVKGQKSDDRKFLLTLLLSDLKKLHKETPGIKSEERIPCICDVCKNEDEPPTFYPLSKLKTRLDNNRRTIECDKPPFEEVQIAKLLGNIYVFSDSNKQDPPESKISKELIEEILSFDDLQKALEMLKKAGKEDAVLYLAKFRRSRSDEAAGIISKEDHDKVVAKLRKAALDLLED